MGVNLSIVKGAIRQSLSIQIYAYYRPQTKFAKVMFLQVSVCPHGGGGDVRGFILL